jgi:hypothetical protein
MVNGKSAIIRLFIRLNEIIFDADKGR